jgi:hypothetical protein
VARPQKLGYDMRYPSAEINGSCFEPKIGTDHVIKRSKVAKLHAERFGALLAVRSNNFRIYVTDALAMFEAHTSPATYTTFFLPSSPFVAVRKPSPLGGENETCKIPDEGRHAVRL